MKQILVALMLSVGLYAGGDIVADIEPIVYEAVEAPVKSPFYVGAGFGIDNEVSRYYDAMNALLDYDIDQSYTNISLLGGAVVASEGSLALAVEGRVAWTLDDYGVDSWGVFGKPEFEVSTGLVLFGLLGYQEITTYDYIYDALGLGAGIGYDFTDSLGVQVDYVYSVIGEDDFGYIPEYSNLTASLLYKF